MVSDTPKKTLGQAIDELVKALGALDEGSRLTAIKAACDHLSITPPVPGAGTLGADAESNRGSSEGLSEGAADIRTLKESKSPASAVEMACLVAYYLQHVAPQEERKEEVTTSDVERYFRQAGYPLPKVMKQLLLNAKAAGYFDGRGGGSYRLNPVGYNLVVHALPRRVQEPVAPRTRSSASKKKRKSVRKTKRRR